MTIDTPSQQTDPSAQPADAAPFDPFPFKVGTEALYQGDRVTVTDVQGVWRLIARYPNDPNVWATPPGGGAKILNREKVLVDRLKPLTMFDQAAAGDDAPADEPDEGGHVKPGSGFISGWRDSRDEGFDEDNDTARRDSEAAMYARADAEDTAMMNLSSADTPTIEGGEPHLYEEVLWHGGTININRQALENPRVSQHLPPETRRKIEAIKAYRELTNEGLKESKDAIEYAIFAADFQKQAATPTIAEREMDIAAQKDARIAELEAELTASHANANEMQRQIDARRKIAAEITRDIQDLEARMRQMKSDNDRLAARNAELTQEQGLFGGLKATVPPQRRMIEVKTVLDQTDTQLAELRNDGWMVVFEAIYTETYNGDWGPRTDSHHHVRLEREAREHTPPTWEAAKAAVQPDIPAPLATEDALAIDPLAITFHVNARPPINLPLQTPVMSVEERTRIAIADSDARIAAKMAAAEPLIQQRVQERTAFLMSLATTPAPLSQPALK